MLETDALAELRALQRKAYGRDGALTAADSARLTELESARTAASQELSAASTEENTASGGAPAADLPPERENSARENAEESEVAASREHDAGSDPEDSVDADSDAAPDTTSWRVLLRRSWKPVAAASALLLAIGIGAGWMLFAPKGDDIPLSSAEAERRSELSSGGIYDPGSVRAIGRDDDALVWTATKSGPDQVCLILDVGERSQAGCADPDFDVNMGGLNASLSVEDPDAVEGGTFGGEMVNASGVRAANGELVVVIQRWNYDSSFLSQFEGAERDRAEALIDEGYEQGLSILGYFRNEPVWFAQRFDDDAATAERCLIVDAISDVGSCAPDDGDYSSTLGVTTADTDGTAASVEVAFTQWGSPYLTITEGLTSGTGVVTDTQTGDPIEIGTPNTDPDD
ncbi:hypothetical protein ACI3KS_00275 [Microbacterium sp. ZW T5_45]|uniref:hypothetical protein n=1 Tax=Microbacterium sp. ZW T5_45 TaxID=3378080 RepID=UPI0038552EE2